MALKTILLITLFLIGCSNEPKDLTNKVYVKIITTCTPQCVNKNKLFTGYVKFYPDYYVCECSK